jgi:hypothetical protein
MNKTCNYILFFILFSFLLNLNTRAGKEEYSKNIEKEYDANVYKSVEIINKYGEIRILDWDKPVIRFEIKITVRHNDQEKANKLLDMISVDFSTESNLVKAITNIDEKFGISNGWFDSKEGKEFHIDYQVSLPKNTNVKLENKYGDIFINELSGLTDIRLGYGNMNINKLSRGSEKPFNQINLAYGKVNIEESNWLNLNISYSKAALQNGKTLIIMSKYSKLKIEKMSTLAGESAYDGYSAQNLDNFVINGKYSDYDINQISKKIETDTKYSNIRVQVVPSSFENINMENTYGKISLGIEANACYEINANVKYGKINYPGNGKVNYISEGNKTTLSGYVGEKNCNSKITISSSYGGVDLIK